MAIVRRKYFHLAIAILRVRIVNRKVRLRGMLKVFLVEDEFVVREGIKNNIDWSAHGYEFCGEATDGEVAFPMIQKLKPDIVITDIKMPFMDGLALSKLIKKEFPWMEIIILSGYETFEYAKEALKIGVAEYLSKPISGDELINEVNNLAIKIEEKRKEREIKEKYMLEMQENYSKDRKDLFQYLISGNKALPELMDIAEGLKINLSAIWYNIVLFEVKTVSKDEEYSKTFAEIEQKLKAVESEKYVIMFDRNLEGKAFIFKGDSQDELSIVQSEFLHKLQNIMAEYQNVRYFGGVGMPVNRLSELTLSFEKARKAFAHRYFVNGNQILNSEEVVYDEATKNEFNISSVDTKQIDRARIKEFLKVGEKEEIVYFVEDFFKDLCKSMESNMFRQYIIMDAYFSVSDFVESIQMPREEIESFDTESDILKNVQTATEYVERIIGQALDMRDKTANNKYGDIVEEITKYIENNYASEELSLNVVAAHVNFSPNHLSMVFSQQTGQSFIKYLTDFRMNKAKELLRCTGKKSSVIASEVGYKDPHYFSYVFKKTQNMTPTQYRGGNGAEGED